MTAEELTGIFRTNLQALRIANKLSQRDLAAKSGIMQSHLSALERGATRPNLHTLVRLATALGVPAWKLLQPLAEENNFSAPLDVD